MGFFVMLFSGILGGVLTYYASKKQKENKLWLIVLFVGLVFLGIAIWLAWPKLINFL